MCQPVVAHGPVVTLNVSVLLRLSRLDKRDVNAPFLGPCQRYAADVFRPVVTADYLRPTAPLNDLIERTDDPLGRQ